MIIYWSGFEMHLEARRRLVIGYVLIGIFMAVRPGQRPPLDWRSAQWLPVYLIGMGIISWQGQFSGGRRGGAGERQHRNIPFWWDMLVVAVFSVIIYFWAMYARLPRDEMLELVGGQSRRGKRPRRAQADPLGAVRAEAASRCGDGALVCICRPSAKPRSAMTGAASNAAAPGPRSAPAAPRRTPGCPRPRRAGLSDSSHQPPAWRRAARLTSSRSGRPGCRAITSWPRADPRRPARRHAAPDQQPVAGPQRRLHGPLRHRHPPQRPAHACPP